MSVGAFKEAKGVFALNVEQCSSKDKGKHTRFI